MSIPHIPTSNHQPKKPLIFLLLLAQTLCSACKHALHYCNIQQQFMFCQSSSLSIFNFLLYTFSPPPWSYTARGSLDSIKPLEHF